MLHKYSVLPRDSRYIMYGSYPQVKLVLLDLLHTPHPINAAPIWDGQVQSKRRAECESGLPGQPYVAKQSQELNS